MSAYNQYLSSKNRLFKRLQRLDDILYFPESSRVTFKFVKLEFKFLDIFLSLQSYMDEPNMLHVTQKVHALFKDALVEFSEFHLAEYFGFCTFKVQHKIWLTKMEIRTRYSFPNITSSPLSANKDGTASTKFVMEFIDIVLENLRDLVNLGDRHSLLYLVKHADIILRELKLLQNFASFVSERSIELQSEHHINFFTHVLALAGHAAMLPWLYFSDHSYEDQDVALGEINVLLFLQMKLKPIQPSIRKIYIEVLQVLKSGIKSGWCPNIQHEQAANFEANFLETILHNLVELPTNSNSGQRDALKDHMEILQEVLNFLSANSISVLKQDLELPLRDIDTTVIDIGLLVYSLHSNEEEEEVMSPRDENPTQVHDLLNNIQSIISVVIKLTIRKPFQSNLPRIHGLGHVDFLLNNLKEFQVRCADSLSYVKNHLQMIQEELESLQPFLQVVSQEPHKDHYAVQRCATQIIDKAYEVEYIVDACISKEFPIWCLERWLLDIIEEITLIKNEVANIHKKKIVGDARDTVTALISSDLATSPRGDEEIVGFEDVTEKLRDQLIKGTRGRDVISIVGMPGLGKTTLAYRLYSDRSVISHFDIRAQCCVSQVYSRKDLLLAILHDATSQNSGCRENLADELADKLRKALFPKRYLILIDDVWEASVWDDLRGCFQDANNGSRIILTTRNHEVANYARFQSEPLSLRMFNDDESWELFKKRIFGEESCPPLLTNIGQQIAKKCGQLPLSVTLVAGILAKMEKKIECWEELAKNLGPHIHKDSSVIIEQSYQMLPYHLRSCFLYFGLFLEDSVIDVSKLIRLWISEGFINSREGSSREDVAESYLENLFGRSLVMRTKKSYGGKTKACHIHDLLHDFCKERAKEKNYLQWMHRWYQMGNSCHKQLANRLSDYYSGYQIGGWSLYKLKFLKVLDLELTVIDFFPTGLVYLRYFAAKTNDCHPISSFLTSSWNLETLILTNIFAKNMSLPITLCRRMVKLRNLHLGIFRFIIENENGLVENSNKLHNLKTLSTPEFSCVQDVDLILSKTPNLQELKFRVKNIPHEYVLNFPTQIKKLKIWREAFTYPYAPFGISAPNLKNFTLKDFHLDPRYLSEGSLQNLQVLNLQSVVFPKGWEVRNGDFPLLKVLKLDRVSFGVKQKWTVGDEAFPILEHLVLRNIYLSSFKEIPSCFEDIASMKSIEVKYCEESICKSARDISERQIEEYQNTGFEVSIIDEWKE